uniref:translation initiation factor 1 n=1 Tax=Juncus tenuis TaxID=932103 RepID=UPI001F13B016|nr:translation initiation factor 1 [Juncus tenuis]ULQ67049.1 translation initiation factor 1 [Juncus tenuis]
MKKKKKYNQKNPKKDRKEQQKPIFEGKIVEPMKDILFHVCLDDTNEIILGYLSGNMRRNRIRVMLGDKVLIEVLEDNYKKGRIISRLLPVPTSDPQTSVEQIKDDPQVKDPSELSKDTEITNIISSNPPQSSDQEERRKEKRNTNDKNSNNQDLVD